jgi:CDP-glucose 4,6-dehydratase
MDELRKFWSGRKVLVTGHTGFKGAWLTFLLDKLGARVSGYSLPQEDMESFYSILNISSLLENEWLENINNNEALTKAISRCNPEIVFHLAAQSLVIKSIQAPIQTFESNIIGSAHIALSALKAPNFKVLVAATSDKVYKNNELGRKFKESDALGGRDPYSASKAAMEITLSAIRETFYPPEKKLVTVRAGNVIGGGDWARNRLIPDLIRSYRESESLNIRSPRSTRPWQHVLDCLSGYLLVASTLIVKPEIEFTCANLGPKESYSVSKLIGIMEIALQEKLTINFLEEKPSIESCQLDLDTSFVSSKLEWKPRLTTMEAIFQTANWYKLYLEGHDMKKVTHSEIEDYFGK